jgi:AcrR family transcriptional regulator
MAKRVEGRSDKLLECAKAEFLEMGFQEASLRVIAAKADTSTGAIYTRFGDKEGLFHALIDKPVNELITWLESDQQEFSLKPGDEQKVDVFSYKPEVWEQLVEYLYDHWDVFRLLVRCTDINCYEEMLNRLVDLEVSYTYQFLRTTDNDAVNTGKLTPMLMHMLSNAYYSGLFDVVRHDMTKEDAFTYVRQIRRFFVQGWADLLGIRPE